MEDVKRLSMLYTLYGANISTYSTHIHLNGKVNILTCIEIPYKTQIEYNNYLNTYNITPLDKIMFQVPNPVMYNIVFIYNSCEEMVAKMTRCHIK